MTQVSEAYEWRGREVASSDGDKIGTSQEIYLDTDSGEPEWGTVTTGLLGTKQSFVPLAEADPSGDRVVVPYTKDQVKDAPSIDPDDELSVQEEQELYRHYGIAYEGQACSGGGRRKSGRESASRESVGRDTSGRTTDDATTRSEEELRVGSERRERGRARLRKYVVTEQEQHTIPVEREEVRVEREPVTDENVEAATSGPDISEAEHEVTLHEEQPVVEKRTVPKERVRMDKEAVTDEREVSEEVRKERVEVEGDDR
jgi:uncharacterized protein (TIGR02271 family)